MASFIPTPAGYAGLFPGHDAVTAKTGSPFAAPGPNGDQAWQFASGQYFDSSTTAAAACNGEMSWAGWIKFAVTPVPYGMILCRDGGSGTAFEISTDGSGGTQRFPYLFSGTTIAGAGSSSAAEPNRWHFWHVTVGAGGSFVWYKDGRLVNTNFFGGTLNASGTWRVNRRLSGTYAGNSGIGEMLLWNRITTAAEAAEVYRFFSARRSSQPIAWEEYAASTYTLGTPTYVPGSITSTGFLPRIPVTVA